MAEPYKTQTRLIRMLKTPSAREYRDAAEQSRKNPNANLGAGAESNSLAILVFSTCQSPREREQSLGEPDDQPVAQKRLLVCDVRRGDRCHAHQDAAVTGHCGEVRRALHRLSNEPQIVDRTIVQPNGLTRFISFDCVEFCHQWQDTPARKVLSSTLYYKAA